MYQTKSRVTDASYLFQVIGQRGLIHHQTLQANDTDMDYPPDPDGISDC